ncbi:ATP-dependent zinc metalloprotease FtsH [Rhodopirellula halodulae]|uniref:ATP-dependent zinc metalloprotease FtsH n=1 Tax=Rhodopirellula halodulae TaxID=2894198 RepID=UPI001E2FBA39|nr:ATP-dependent zinc metalloprotease FtsH [Rhodopirellula sp. JC737]MCC9658203.1 ATP-dependent zinc metalloprotease FtsH [Rhodopirellula sp. JC737]
MSNEPKSKRGGSSENRSGGNVWLVLLAVTAAVVLSAFLFSDNRRRLAYPHLKELLAKEAEFRTDSNVTDADASGETNVSDETIVSRETSDAIETSSDESANSTEDDATIPAVVVESSTKENVFHEFSRLSNVLVADDRITGKVFFRAFTPNHPSENAAAEEVNFVTIRGYPNDVIAAELQGLLEASGVDWDNDRPSRFLENHWPELLMIGVLVALGIVMLKRMGGVGSPMSFSRSRGKLYSEDDLPTTFEDVAGIEEAVDEVREVVDFLKNSDKYHNLGGRIPKGVLLVGPPGTGKTLLAKAIAGEAGVPFFSLSGSDFVEMFVGVGAARVRDMFQQAVNRAPCIIFIDELDALGKSRSGSVVGGHDEREQTLNALLVEMDGFDSNSGVIVVAATNRPETLDPALLRPGRFDRHVLVDRPDVAGREEILGVHVKNVKLDESVELKGIASITSGFVGADLANLVNEAALLAARNGKPAVAMEEFNEAVERVTAGLEKKKRVMNEDEKIRVAYHESGHALVAAALPNTDPVHKVSIIPRGLAALGYMMQRPETERFLMTKSELESQMKVMLAGTLAEEMIFQDISTGAQNDLERCTETARSMVMDYGMSRLGRINLRRNTRSPFLAGSGGGEYQVMHSDEMAKMIDKEVSRIVDDMLAQTREILEQRRDVLEAVTQRLLEVEAIDSDELLRLIEEHSRGPWLVPGTVTEKPKAKIVHREEAPLSDRGSANRS